MKRLHFASILSTFLSTVQWLLDHSAYKLPNSTLGPRIQDITLE